MPPRTGGTWQLFTAATALAVSASTPATDVAAFKRFGHGLAIALGLAFLVIVRSALSAAYLATA